MLKRIAPLFCALIAGMLLLSCTTEKIEITVAATLEGAPVSDAIVTLNGIPFGKTDAAGTCTGTLTEKPGSEVQVAVVHDLPGYRIQPWSRSFVIKIPRSESDRVYRLDAALNATKYMTVLARHDGEPVPDAVVKEGGREAGRTDGEGMFVHAPDRPKGSGLDLEVMKQGYAVWRQITEFHPGEVVRADLIPETSVRVRAEVEEYGIAAALPDVLVTVDGKPAGKTDRRGMFVYIHKGEPGKRVVLKLQAPGSVPESRTAVVIMKKEKTIRRVFRRAASRPVNAVILGFQANAAGEDLREAAARVESAMESQMSGLSCFRHTPAESVHDYARQKRISLAGLLKRGWSGSALHRSVDLIATGSVSRDDRGFLIEATCRDPSGKILVSRMFRARNHDELDDAGRIFVKDLHERFPFEGTVIAEENGRFQVNLGRKSFKIRKGAKLVVRPAEGGQRRGMMAVTETGDDEVWAESEGNTKIAVGDRVVRQAAVQDAQPEKPRILAVAVYSGGETERSPLPGVNVYADGEWIGATDNDGRLDALLPKKRKTELVLYRHGYQQAREEIRIQQDREAREFVLAANSTLFTVDSDPQGAEVFIDDELIGITPLLEARPVPFGFRTVRLSLRGDYRDWEKILEFSGDERTFTGDARVRLDKDYLKIGKRAEQSGNADGAIAAYRAADKEHPDYCECRRRLARLYLDEKNDFDAAIREFEQVLSMPGNRELIYKRFAVVYANLGQAYYEKGNRLLSRDRQAAEASFARALQSLRIARQNTRFFPNDAYHEAVHDTYYFAALAQHKRYLLSRRADDQDQADRAWREYFDFFPDRLSGNETYEKSREAGRLYWNQVRTPESWARKTGADEDRGPR